jgi:prolyl oligopeptidase
MRMAAVLVAAALVATGAGVAEEDPWLWLEEVESGEALAWARAQNARAESRLTAHPEFERIHQRNLEILTSDERLALPELQGGAIYNFWRDASHVRGLWRGTTLASYRGKDPEWQPLLDIDRLAEAEQQNWVWSGANCRYPEYDRCLVSLSIGGADASVQREFDLESRTFVADGFQLPESKSSIAWRDLDSVFVGPVFHDAQVTDSGYPRTVQIWRRGTPVEEAETVFEGERGDVGSFASRIWDGDNHYDVIIRAPDFFSREYHLLRDGKPLRLNIPSDTELAGIIDGQLLVQLKSDWKPGERSFRQGALVAGPVDTFLEATPRVELVFAPGPRAAVTGVSTTRNTVLVTATAASRCRGCRATPAIVGSAWLAAAASTCWPTSAAAASSGPAGTRRRCWRSTSATSTTSSPSPRTSSRARSPRPSTWASSAAATAGCWSAQLRAAPGPVQRRGLAGARCWT